MTGAPSPKTVRFFVFVFQRDSRCAPTRRPWDFVSSGTTIAVLFFSRDQFFFGLRKVLSSSKKKVRNIRKKKKKNWFTSAIVHSPRHSCFATHVLVLQHMFLFVGVLRPWVVGHQVFPFPVYSKTSVGERNGTPQVRIDASHDREFFSAVP